MPRDWAAADYSRIYHTVVDDSKFAEVFDDDRRWAAYTRLLMLADAAYPSPAPLPRWLADDVLEHLVEARIITLFRGSSYRIVGLVAEREGRLGGKSLGGKSRSDGAERDEQGRFLPKPVDEPSAGTSETPAIASNGQHRTSTAAPADDQLSSLDEDKTRIDETRISLRRESRARPRVDVDALLERPGWTKVTRAQRRVLDEILTRHDVTGPEFAAEVIRATPPDQDPLEAVMAADRMWQETQRRRADAEEAKAVERRNGDRAPTQLGSVLRETVRRQETVPVGDAIADPLDAL